MCLKLLYFNLLEEGMFLFRLRLFVCGLLLCLLFIMVVIVCAGMHLNTGMPCFVPLPVQVTLFTNCLSLASGLMGALGCMLVIVCVLCVWRMCQVQRVQARTFAMVA